MMWQDGKVGGAIGQGPAEEASREAACMARARRDSVVTGHDLRRLEAAPHPGPNPDRRMPAKDGAPLRSPIPPAALPVRVLIWQLSRNIE